MPDRKPIRNLDMPHRRLTCLIGDPSETDIPDRRPTYPIGDQHVPSETDMPVETHRSPTCLLTPIGIMTHIVKFTYFSILKKCKDSNQACWSLMGLRLGMSVFNGLSIRHVCFRWFSDEACRGLRSGMSVSDRSSFRESVSDYNNSFVNSPYCLKSRVYQEINASSSSL